MKSSLLKLLALCREEPALWVWLVIDTASTFTIIALLLAL
jgi:hypothetical protein